VLLWEIGVDWKWQLAQRESMVGLELPTIQIVVVVVAIMNELFDVSRQLNVQTVSWTLVVALEGAVAVDDDLIVEGALGEVKVVEEEEEEAVD